MHVRKELDAQKKELLRRSLGLASLSSMHFGLANKIGQRRSQVCCQLPVGGWGQCRAFNYILQVSLSRHTDDDPFALEGVALPFLLDSVHLLLTKSRRLLLVFLVKVLQ